MEIIILFIVFGIVGNIIKGISSNKGTAGQQRPRQNDPRQVYRGMLDGEREDEERLDSGSQTHSRIQPTEEPVVSGLRETSGERRGLGDYLRESAAPSEPMRVISLDGEEPSPITLSFKRDDFVQGIIFSEILKPPKGRRQ